MKPDSVPVLAFDSRNSLPLEARFVLKECSKVAPVYLICSTKHPPHGLNAISPQSLNYHSEYSEFSRTYVHLSPNTKTYELACFERYFAYLALAKRFGWSYFWVIDTDVLVTQSLALWNSYGCSVFSAPNPDDAVSAHCALFSFSDLENFVAYLRAEYFSDSNLPKLKVEFASKQARGAGGINDMTALAQWLKDEDVTWVNAESMPDLPKISHVFPSEFMAKSRSLSVTISDSIVLHSSGRNECDYFSAIHFQGGSKFMIFPMIFWNGRFLTSNSWATLERFSSKLASGLQVLRRIRASLVIRSRLGNGIDSINSLS